MALPVPNLDDRTFLQLVEEAKARIALSSSNWNDFSPGDPGMVLLEAFAYLTELMIFRLNRLPDKAYVEFLQLMDVKLNAPAAAGVVLRFFVSRPQATPIEIARGTRVTLARAGGAEPPMFVTAAPAVIGSGSLMADVQAYHCSQIEAELAGLGTGMPGQSVQAQRPPMIAPTGDALDLVVGVEASEAELGERVPALVFNNKTYRIWREVDNFTELGPDRYVYLCDRMSGTIRFAPALRSQATDRLAHEAPALAETPGPGREIRLWYRRGGGAEGNIGANTLSVLKDAIAGVQVSNPMPATGGLAAETLQGALLRGPQEIHSLRRAVTARDFETVAVRSSGAVARAKAFTKAALWRHAQPGTVEVLLVPHYRDEAERGGGAVSVVQMRALETEDARVRIAAALDTRRPLATYCLVNWVRYKTVQVKARVVVYRGEDTAAVKRRVVDRLHQVINPLPTPSHRNGWRFGEPLRVSHVYDIVLSEPGVSYADRVRLWVDQVPGRDVRSLAADFTQPDTWYAASADILFRSLNDGAGWEPAGEFPGQRVDTISINPDRPGALAVSTMQVDSAGAMVHVSRDCGETWRVVASLAFRVNKLAWLARGTELILLLATDQGLFELALASGATPIPVAVDQGRQDRGFYAVTTFADVRGAINVAVAAQEQGGVFLSRQAGQSATFKHIGLRNEDVRVLAVQREGVRSFLWAGLSVPGNETGKGCFRWDVPAAPDSFDAPEGWRPFSNNWSGGSCRALVFDGGKVFAGTHHAGVVRLDMSRGEPAWQAPNVSCGLPIRDVERLFYPVDAIAIAPDGSWLMAGGSHGVYRSNDDAMSYASASQREFLEMVALPPTWLFCSGTHEIDVVGEDDANRD
jgi:hypothetical protein